MGVGRAQGANYATLVPLAGAPPAMVDQAFLRLLRAEVELPPDGIVRIERALDERHAEDVLDVALRETRHALEREGDGITWVMKTAINSSLGSIQNDVVAAPPQAYSPGLPGISVFA